MITIIGSASIGGNFFWEIFDSREWDKFQGFTVRFPLYGKYNLRESLSIIHQNLIENKIEWLQLKNKLWIVDMDLLKKQSDFFEGLDYLEGEIIILPEIEHEEQKSISKSTRNKTIINFVATIEDIMESKPKKIFLSHKGIDKPLVREYKKTLETLGYEPWLDEDSLIAGTELERGLLKGFKESCAAIFFITSNFSDENFLATEINYAIAEKREKGDRFSIITMVLPNNKSDFKIPDLLKTYVWKQPSSELEAIREIIKAIPLKHQGTIFK